jgi:hypothetical protein
MERSSKILAMWDKPTAHILILKFPLKLKVGTCESLGLLLDLSTERGN